MNTPDEVRYRLGLAKGFLAEAEQDMTLQRWRSCVDNAQLAAENAGKAALALFVLFLKPMILRNRLLSCYVNRHFQKAYRLSLKEWFLTC